METSASFSFQGLEKFMFHESGVFNQRLDSIFAKNIVMVWGRLEPRRCCQPPTLPLQGRRLTPCRKDEAAYFSRNFVCILRTSTTRHTVSFIDFCFHSSKFPDLNFAPYVLSFCL